MNVRPGFLIALLAVVVVSAVIVISIMRDRPNVVGLTPQEAPTDVNWRVIGAFIDGPKTKFVEIKAGRAKDRAEYDNAVNTLCHETSFCTIAFFLPGDRVPTNQSAKDFFDTGGWSNYPVLAFWWGTRDSASSRYTGWDCDRVGADGAPTEALCGPGVSEAYSAVLALAGRAGTAEACRWPKNDDAKLTVGYIDNIKEPARQEQFRKGYGLLYQATKKGPDDPTGCSIATLMIIVQHTNAFCSYRRDNRCVG